MAAKKKVSVRARTPRMIATFPKLFQPDTGPEGDGRPAWSIGLIATAEEQKTPAWKEVKQAALTVAAAWAGSEEKARELIKNGSLKWPFRQDGEGKGHPAGSVFFNARSYSQPPGVVANVPAEPGSRKPRVITEEDQVVGGPFEVYSGSTVIASVTFYFSDKVGNRVCAALNNVQKVGEGERMDNRTPADEEFEADLAETPASLEGTGLDEDDLV